MGHSAARLLLVEDDPSDARLVQDMLTQSVNHDFSLTHVESLSQALQSLSKENFDIVLLKLNLPDSQKLATFQRMKAQVPALPMVLWIAPGDETLGVKAVQVGAQDYLVKGQVDSKLLVHSLVCSLERHRLEEIRRNETIRVDLMQTVEVVSLAMERRDPYTHSHQQRVAQLAVTIAREMNLAPEQINGIYVGALIHDIGKVRIPELVLSYPGRLYDAEFGLVKIHPTVGYEIVKGIDSPWQIARMVLQHHERLDGSGYPQGVKGESIVLEAKVLAVADVVEAMSSHRPYRPALGVDKALEEIRQNKGVLYHAGAVDACMSVFEKGFKFA